MNDPFEVLRSTPPADVAPDVGAIRGRARRIERRRQLLVSGSAVSIAAVALIAVLAGLGPDERTDLASRDTTTQPTPDTRALQSDAVAPQASAPQSAKKDNAARAETAGSGSAQAPAAAAGVSPQAADPLVATIDEVTPRALGGADFRLEVCNSSSEPLERSFPDAQRYDFRVHKDGEVIWMWSDDRMFAQTTGTETWAAGECKRWSDGWDGRNAQGARATDGTYDVVGTLVGKPEVASKPVSFCHGIC